MAVEPLAVWLSIQDMNEELYQRFKRSPGLLEGRRQRRMLRRMAWPVGVLLAVSVGIIHDWGGSGGSVILTVGRTLSGLIAMGFAGLIVGVFLVLIAIIVYNGLLNGHILLIDVYYIDEIPLIFACLLGVVGVFWSLRWPEMFGLIGWGLIVLVANAFLFRKHNDKTSVEFL